MFPVASGAREPLALELVGEIEQHKMSTIGAAVRAIRARESHTLPDRDCAKPCCERVKYRLHGGQGPYGHAGVKPESPNASQRARGW